MAYTVIKITDAARGLKYYSVEVSTGRIKNFKLADDASDAQITKVVDYFLESERVQAENDAKIQKAIDEALIPDEAK
tara:strand:+ start:3746 stop:3976 length:231 start_codon:yes stop_codon:yes gene_type:complete